MNKAKCAKIIMFKAAAGKNAQYSTYLRESVEPIDERAVKESALLDMMTLVNDSDASLPWTHLRIFLFDSEAQRAGVKGAFARIAPELQPDEAKRKARKAYGEGLRALVAEVDVELLG